VQVDNLNQNATEDLLADADRAVALTRVQDLREAARLEMVADTRKNYIELQRRSRPLIMSDTDVISFQRSLDRLRACLRFFNVTV
jgi:hypothetical protein